MPLDKDINTDDSAKKIAELEGRIASLETELQSTKVLAESYKNVVTDLYLSSFKMQLGN